MLVRKIVILCAILPIIWSANIYVPHKDWKIWATEEVLTKCTNPLIPMTINDTITCSDFIQHKITGLRIFFVKIENAIENTTYGKSPSGWHDGTIQNFETMNNRSLYLYTNESWFGKSEEVSAHIMKDIYQDRVDLFVLMEKLKQIIL